MLREFEYRPIGDAKAEIYINGQKIDGVTSVVFEQTAITVPAVTLEIAPIRASISQLADLELRISSDSVEQAIDCIRFNLMLDEEFKSNFRGRIYDILRDVSDRELKHDYEKANFIVERILEDLQ